MEGSSKRKKSTEAGSKPEVERKMTLSAHQRANWPGETSPGPAVKHHIDTNRSRSEQREHEEERERHPARSTRRDRQDGQKNDHAHQHAQRNKGQRQALNGCGRLAWNWP